MPVVGRASRRAGMVGLALLLAGCAGGGPVTPVTVSPATTGIPAGAASNPTSVESAPSTRATVPSSPSPSPSPTPPTTAPASGPVAAAAPDAATTDPDHPVLPASAPLRLSVPAIGIDSPLVDLGRNPDGTVEVPSLDDPDARPGWYRDSPTPGARGPAIILGHVDSRRYGPGVFYHLAELRTGDTVDVARTDGSVARFAVDEVRVVAKRDFPTLEVYGNLDHAGLRLITCGGAFDSAAGSYESNVIVFASLTGAG